MPLRVLNPLPLFLPYPIERWGFFFLPFHPEQEGSSVLPIHFQTPLRARALLSKLSFPSPKCGYPEQIPSGTTASPPPIVCTNVSPLLKAFPFYL